ncbi:MAG: hypothetical protein J5805_05370 [Bacteroidaceae bacterium]|nr:hypothetical protein [Bacteroidaceae bacterium]
MKRKVTFSIVLSLFVFLTSLETSAKSNIHRWAIAVMENNSESPTIIEYYSELEKAENNVDYFRIYDAGYIFRKDTHNPIQLPYGFRLADKQIYIYDYNKIQESLAFDFNLAVGDHFTTFNGMEWIVESVKDTLVNISFCGMGESVSKKLLTVKSLDGTLTDQWLEDFGSFINHFMIKSLDNVKCSQTLWMEYGYGEYLAREINADPLYAHDSGWMDGHYNSGEEETDARTNCYYENDQVVFESFQWAWAHRDYSCFYRDGDDIYRVYLWELNPQVDGGNSELKKDVAILKGLPAPTSGKYKVHVGDDVYSTGINNVRISSQSEGKMFDLQGRKLSSEPSQGLYIKDRQKVYKK